MTRLEAKKEMDALRAQIEKLESIADAPPAVLEPKLHVWAMRDPDDALLVWFHFRTTNWLEVEASRKAYYEATGNYPGGLPQFGCQGYQIGKDGKFVWQGGWIVVKTWEFSEDMLANPVPNHLLSTQFNNQ